jgi:transglutaminase-like putative cysteine protease
MKWKRVAAVTVFLLALGASAAQAEFSMLGYRALDPFASRGRPAPPLSRAERYRINLNAYLTVQENPRAEEVQVFLPLPADNAYQVVYSARLQPAPSEIVHSRYGQRYAAFNFGKLAKGATFEIHYTAEAAVAPINWAIDPNQIGPLDEVPRPIADDYLVDAPVYQIHHRDIELAAREAVGEERRPFQMMAKILRWVHQRLEYRIDGKKLSAVKTIEARHGSCTEHSFVMIALARHLGLPARYISGSFIRPDPFTPTFQDRANHKIVEVYFPRVGWTPVESTGIRRLAIAEPEKFVGGSTHLMFFFATEPEPGLAPIDPRRNILTRRLPGVDSQVEVRESTLVTWRRLR